MWFCHLWTTAYLNPLIPRGYMGRVSNLMSLLTVLEGAYGLNSTPILTVCM